MLCAAVAPEYNINVEENHNNQQQNLLKKKTKGKEVSNESDDVQEPLLKDLSLAFSTNDNDNGNISIDNNNQYQTVLDRNGNELNIIRQNSNESNHSSSIVDLPLANGSSSSLNIIHDASKLSYDEIPYRSGMSLSCSSIRPDDHINKSFIDNGSHFSEDESFVYNSHLSEIDRNEDIKDLRIKLKKAIKSLDKKKKDLTLAAVIGQCLLEANTNLKTLNYKLMNKRDSDGSSIGSFTMNSELDPSSSLIQNHKKFNQHGNVRVYTGVGRQEKNHINLIPENESLDENTYNSVVEYHEENYNRVIKQLTDINNQLENSNLDLRRQVNDLEEVVKDTKNKYNRGLVESEKKLNEMEIKLNTMTELNDKLFKDNQDLIKEFSHNNNYKNNEIKQEQKLIDSLYNELYDMQHKIEEVNKSKENCEKKYEKLNMEYIKSQGEIDELKKVQEQNKIIEQVNNEQENRIKELHEYMEYQRDYISRLENQLFFCAMNPMNNKLLKNEKIVEEEDDRIVELTDDDDKENDIQHDRDTNGDNQLDSEDSDNSHILINSDDSTDEHEDSDESGIVFSSQANKDNKKKISNIDNKNENRYLNSQLVLYSPNIFHQILSNAANNSNINNMNNNNIGSNIINNQLKDKDNNNNNSINNKKVSINDVNDNNVKANSIRGLNLNGNKITLPEAKAKKRISINNDGIITKQTIFNDNKDDIKRKRRASTNNILSNEHNKFSYANERQRRKSLNIVPNNQFIYSYGNPMFNSNNLLKSSDESSDRDSSEHENDESLDKFQHDIKKMFKPRPPVKKMKMNKQEKKMIKKIKMDKLNDIIQTSENSISCNTPSSSFLVVPRNSSFNSLSSSSIKNSFANPDSREYITSHDYSDVHTIPSQNNININTTNSGNINDKVSDNNINKNKNLSVPIQNNSNKGKLPKNDIKKTAVVPINALNNNTTPKNISSFPNNNKLYKPTSPLIINNTLESSTSETSFLKNEREHPHYKKSNNPTSSKPQRRTFKSIFLRNPFSSNFSSSNLSSSNVSTSHFSSPSISSWTTSSTSNTSNNNNKHQDEPSSNILKTSTSTMDINSYAPELDLSTQIIIKNDSEIIDSNNNNIKTSELLWNKENDVGKEQLLRDPANKEILSSDVKLERSDSNVSEESHKNRNKVAKILFKGWLHVVDGISLFNPYHNSYRLDSYSYEQHDSIKDDNGNTSSDQADTSNSKALIPFDPDKHRLSTTHFFNSYY